MAFVIISIIVLKLVLSQLIFYVEKSTQFQLFFYIKTSLNLWLFLKFVVLTALENNFKLEPNAMMKKI